MAFSDFTFPDVLATLELDYREAGLFASVEPMPLRTDFAETLREGVDLALRVFTEKARSEFIIAPLLLELRRALHASFGLFSGTEFTADAARGLNGYCDFILARSPLQAVLAAPLVAIVEAKNDNLRSGLGQCIASMFAALLVNDRAGDKRPVWGCVTTGTSWKFLRLERTTVTADIPEYLISDPGRLLGIFRCMIEGVPAP